MIFVLGFSILMIPLTAWIVASAMSDQTDRLLEHLEETRVIGGQPLSVIEKRAEEIAEKKDRLKPVKQPADLLR